jgi:hypothetical protein
MIGKKLSSNMISVSHLSCDTQRRVRLKRGKATYGQVLVQGPQVR